MILTASVKKQLGTFTLLAAVALGLIAVVYARIPASLGIGVYNVKAEFKDASGLYPKALVTFHGVEIGEVTSLTLTPSLAIANLRLSSGTAVPANVVAELHSTSAIGEQYVDLVPKGSPVGTLTGGAVLDPSRTVPMPQITPVLDSLNHLLRSVPLKATTNVLDEVNAGLGSEGPTVNQLIDSSTSLVGTAQQQIAATTDLIRTLQPVLVQQQHLAPQTVSYMSSLNQFTRELATKDADLRSLLAQGPGGLVQANVTVSDLRKSLPPFLENFNVTGSVLNTYLRNLQQIFVVYPPTLARIQSTLNPQARNGEVQLDVRAGANNPPSCTSGYVPIGDRRSPSDTSVRAVHGLPHCVTAPASPQSVRGARNLPCPNSAARGPSPAACGLIFGHALWPPGYDSSAASAGSDSAGAGAPLSSTAASTSWEQWFLQPLGLWGAPS